MQEINFRNQSFADSETIHCDLTVQVSPDGITYLIRHSERGTIMLYHFYPCNYQGYSLLLRKTRDIISGNEILKRSFAKTVIIFTDRRFMLIPEALFSEKLVQQLLSTKGKTQEERETVVIPYQQMNAFLAFTVEKELYDYLTVTFPGAEISHEAYPLLQNLIGLKTPVVNFHIHPSWFIAAGIGQKGVEFLNTFDYSNETDLIYYLLSVMKQPSLSSFPVLLSGWVDPDDSKVSFIKKYLPGAKINDFPESRFTAPEIIPYHRLPGIISI